VAVVVRVRVGVEDRSTVGVAVGVASRIAVGVDSGGVTDASAVALAVTDAVGLTDSVATTATENGVRVGSGFSGAKSAAAAQPESDVNKIHPEQTRIKRCIDTTLRRFS
jgi:hypothetical protein